MGRSGTQRYHRADDELGKRQKHDLPPQSQRRQHARQSDDRAQQGGRYGGNRPSGHAAVHVDEIGLRQQHHRRYEYKAGDSFAPRLATEAHAAKHIASGHPDNRMCGVGPGAGGGGGPGVRAGGSAGVCAARSGVRSGIGSGDTGLVEGHASTPMISGRSSSSPMVANVKLANLLMPRLAPALACNTTQLADRGKAKVMRLICSMSFSDPTVKK